MVFHPSVAQSQEEGATHENRACTGITDSEPKRERPALHYRVSSYNRDDLSKRFHPLRRAAPNTPKNPERCAHRTAIFAQPS